MVAPTIRSLAYVGNKQTEDSRYSVFFLAETHFPGAPQSIAARTLENFQNTCPILENIL
jgi:hypothetical protein